MEVTGRHAYTKYNKFTFWKTNVSQRKLQFWSFGIWDSRKCWVWAIYNMLRLEVRTNRYRAFTCLETRKNRVLFFVQFAWWNTSIFPQVYIDGFFNSHSICLDYAYQLVESLVTHGKYEDNMHLFNSSSAVCYIGSKRLFMRTTFIRTNKLRLVQ